MNYVIFVVKTIIALGLAQDATSQLVIYVSRVKGNDSTTCGSQDFPCHTIARAVSQAQFSSSIFLDSTNTTRSPYKCQPLTSSHQGIYVTKTLAFVSGPSVAHVACEKGQNWVFNGSASSVAMEVNLTGISFYNSRLHFLETSIAVNHCVFSRTETLVMNIVSHQNLTRLSLQNVRFETNEACISMTSSSDNSEVMQFISINITDSDFYNNGVRSIPILPSPTWTILGVSSSGHPFVDISIKNSNFSGSFVRSSGMIYVSNQLGQTDFYVQDVVFTRNGLQDTREGNSLLMLSSSIVSLVISRSQVRKNEQRLLSIYSTWTKINASNMNVDDFLNPQQHGGSFYIESYAMNLLINDCSFSNGKSINGHAGLLFVFGGDKTILIENSIFSNLMAFGDGGVIYATARQHVTASIKLNITNSSFISNVARNGGVIGVLSHTTATVSINNSNFFMNKALSQGGFLYSLFVNLAEVFIGNTLFERNTAILGSCISVPNESEQYVEFVLSGSNVTFIRNRAVAIGGVFAFVANVINVSFSHVLFEENGATAATGGVISVSTNQRYKDRRSLFSLTARHVRFEGNFAIAPGGVLYVASVLKSILVFKDVVFLRNTAQSGPGGAIYHVQLTGNKHLTSFQYLLKRCIFEENFSTVGGAIYLQDSNGKFECEDSLFRSNSASEPGGALTLYNSWNCTIDLVNTTFFNNTSTTQTGGAVYLDIGKESRVRIVKAKFEQNNALQSSGGGLSISASDDTILISGCDRTWRAWNHNTSVEVKNTYFRNNVAGSGGAVSMTDGSVNFTNCDFFNNNASLQGSHIINYGTNSLKFINCTFRQTLHTIYPSAAIQTYSAGPFVLTNTIIDQRGTLGSKPIIMVSKGGLVEFDNLSSIICPLGASVSWLNLSYNDYINRTCTFNITAFRLGCKECERGLYSLQRGHTRGLEIVDDITCLSCPRGAVCISQIKSKPNFWGYLIDTSKPALRFTLCPDGYCFSGTRSSEDYNSCFGNRNDWMCGRCADGYSETLFSTECVLSQDCDDNWFWLVIVTLVFIIALFLVFKPPIVTFASKQVFWFKNHCVTCKQESTTDEGGSLTSLNIDLHESSFVLSTEEIENEMEQSGGFLEIIFYFYQISYLFLTTTSMEQLLKTKVIIAVQGFFNFQGRLLGHGVVCPLPGLTPQTKQLLEVSPIFGTFGAIYVIYALHYIVCKILRTAPPALGRYLGATMETLLLGYTKIANVSLSLIRCVPVGSESRWFYNGTIVCYQWWQIVLMAFNAMFVVPFIFVLAWGAVKLHRGTVSVKQLLLACVFPLPFLIIWLIKSFVIRDNQCLMQSTQYTKALKGVLLAPFREPEAEKTGALYWESIFIGRRFILVFLYCFITDSTLRLLCMGVVCVLALLHHSITQPFRNKYANIAETTSLLALVILANINMYKSFYTDSKQDVSNDWMAIFQILDWLEILILGFLPALVALLVLFTSISLVVRLIFVLYNNTYKRIHTRLIRSHGRAPLVVDN